MILLFLILVNSEAFISCEQELKHIIEENILKSVNSYVSEGYGLDWFDSFEKCKERPESMYSAVQWKLNTAVKATYGFCIPTICNQTTSEQVLPNLLKDDQLKKIPSDEVTFVLFNFTSANEMHPVGKLFITLLYLLLFLTCLFSTLGIFYKKEIFLNFSIFWNFKKFFNYPNNFGNLQFFDGIRSISSISLLFLHGFFMMSYIPMRNRSEFNSLFSTFPFTLIVSMSLTVDIFFLMSGFLMSFLTIQEIRKKKDFKWFNFLLKRLIRYLPVYFFVIGLERSSAGVKPSTIGSVIPYVTTLNLGKDWWGSLLFIHNLLSDKDAPYLSWTWSVACDFQFYLICSFILNLYIKRKTSGYLAIFTLLSSSMIYTGSISYHYSFSPSSIKTILDLVQINTIYVRPFPRLGAFLVGLVFGLLYLEVSQKQGKESQAYQFENGFGDKLERHFKRLVYDRDFLHYFYPASAVLIAWVIVGPFYLDYYGENSLNPAVKAIWIAFQRPVFALVVGFFMVLMALGNFSIFRGFLAIRVFQYFSKISYCFFMIHCMVFGAFFMNGSEFIDGNFGNWVFSSFHAFQYSTFIAFLLEVILQMPFVGLAARLMR